MTALSGNRAESSESTNTEEWIKKFETTVVEDTEMDMNLSAKDTFEVTQ
jgi:hypothetical protein